MEIKLVPAQGLPTEVNFDGKEFVSLDAFLAAFSLAEDVEMRVRSIFRTCCIEEVQKRDEGDLLLELTNKCLGKRETLYSPIVTKDGWVYWIYSGHHWLILEALAQCYSNGERDNSDFILEQGVAWQICSARPNVIMYGRNYKPTRNDRGIFELFTVEIIDTH